MAEQPERTDAGVSRRNYMKLGAAGLAGISFASRAAGAQGQESEGTDSQTPTLIKDGTIVTVDPEHGIQYDADVLVRDGRIDSIGSDITAPSAEIIDASDAIVVPGFVNAHLHTWESQVRAIAGDWTFLEYLDKMLGNISGLYRPQDAYLGNLFGGIQQLNAGTTTVLDWFHIANSPAHTNRAIEGIHDAGIRTVFAHGPPGDDSATWWEDSTEPHPDDIRRLAREFPLDDGRLTLAMGIRGPDYSTDEVLVEDIELARELGILASMHIGSLGPGGVETLDELGLLGDDLNYVHANRLTDEEFQLIGESGGSITTTPEVELQMGMGMPVLGEALEFGAVPSVGVDIVSAVSDDLFTQNRMALQVQRGLNNQSVVEAGEQIQNVNPSTYRALELATIDGARAIGLDDEIGSITPGKRADLTLISTDDLNVLPPNDPVETVVLQAGVVNVDTVLVDGEVVKRDGNIINSTARERVDQFLQSSDRILRESGLEI